MDNKKYNECKKVHGTGELYKGNADLYKGIGSDKMILVGRRADSKIIVALDNGNVIMKEAKDGCSKFEILDIKENKDFIENLVYIEYTASDYDFIMFLNKHVPIQYWKNITPLTYSWNTVK